MKLIQICILTVCGGATALLTAFAGNDLIVRSGGTLIVHTNVLVNSGTFQVDNGGAVNIDLGSRITATNIIYGGTLTVASRNLVLAGGQNYQLFSANSYSGAFLTVNLPSLDSSLAWSNTLSGNGTIAVRTVSGPTMQFGRVTTSGGQMTLSGSGGVPLGTYVVLSSTNVALAKASWTVLATNTCGPAGEFSFTAPVQPGVPQQFFLLQVP